MVHISQNANRLQVKKLFGNEETLQKWLKENPMFFILEIEYFRYRNRHLEYTEGFFIYYTKT